jgi:uncharacterized protein
MGKKGKHTAMAVVAVILQAAACLAAQDSITYFQQVERWRTQREENLRNPDGWLSLAGLYWLKEGKNTVGTDKKKNDFVLPPHSAPKELGTFIFHAGHTNFEAAPDILVDINGAQVTSGELLPDTSNHANMLRFEHLTMYVIERGAKYGIRLKDQDAPTLHDFHGLSYFPMNEKYRVTAKFIPYDPPKQIPIANILGQVENTPCPGRLEFTLDGKPYSLDPLTEGNHLFIIFKDLTSGVESYPAARFLYTDMPLNGKVELDFNKAINPPCAFTPFATCPLPPKQNVLPLRIEAGEKNYAR